DVNTHLRLFKLPDAFDRPVTIANLLTHTGGFDDRWGGVLAPTEAQMVPLGDYLATRMPPRVMPPGAQFRYSKPGIALAGYVVEVVSGMPFAQYVEQNILQPLQMSHSSYRLPPQIAQDLATGYEFRNDRYEKVPFDYLNAAPAGALNSTAMDMAHFII